MPERECSRPTLAAIRRAVRGSASARRARISAWFFKTGKGGYGEGDRFLGLRVPQVRTMAKQFGGLAERDVLALLRSAWHEERLLALILLVGRSDRANRRERMRLRSVYLAHRRFVNNWDLVDTSAPALIGRTLTGPSVPPFLRTLAASRVLWDRRMALLATFDLIRRDEFQPTVFLGRMLLEDREDLMHKAMGWMLREIWQRNPGVAERFLRRHLRRLPRTAFRYAIERMPASRRARFLSA